jgi:hypothetical protein
MAPEPSPKEAAAQLLAELFKSPDVLHFSKTILICPGFEQNRVP